MNSKVAIGIATTGTVKTKTLFSVVQLVKTGAKLVTWDGCNVHQARENIAMAVQKSDCTHLLFIDSDMVFDKEALDILLKRDKDIIGADYNMRKLPLTSTVKIHDEDGEIVKKDEGEIFECYAVATGFMLIKMEVFEKLAHPWFLTEHDTEGNMTVGSDMYFCREARKAGYKIYCDPTIKVKHQGDYEY